MEVYRIYRRNIETNKLEETSYAGNKKLIRKILKSLDKSKLSLFTMIKEN